MDDSDLAQRAAHAAKRAAEVTEAASEFVTDTFEELIDKTTSANPDVRFLAASRMVLSDDDDPRALPVFIRLMDDPSARVRSSAALGLSHYAIEESRSALVDHLRNDGSEHVRAACARTLGLIGGADDEIIAALSDHDWRVRMSSATSLGRLGNTSAAPHIVRLLDDPRWDVQYFACTALLNLGVSSAQVIETIAALSTIPEARETLECFAETDVMMKVIERFPEDLEQLGDDVTDEQILDALRQKYGDEAVPRQSTDPIGDLIERAERLCNESAEPQMNS